MMTAAAWIAVVIVMAWALWLAGVFDGDGN